MDPFAAVELTSSRVPPVQIWADRASSAWIVVVMINDRPVVTARTPHESVLQATFAATVANTVAHIAIVVPRFIAKITPVISSSALAKPSGGCNRALAVP